jgi:hypothetical protein
MKVRNAMASDQAFFSLTFFPFLPAAAVNYGRATIKIALFYAQETHRSRIDDIAVAIGTAFTNSLHCYKLFSECGTCK